MQWSCWLLLLKVNYCSITKLYCVGPWARSKYFQGVSYLFFYKVYASNTVPGSMQGFLPAFEHDQRQRRLFDPNIFPKIHKQSHLIAIKPKTYTTLHSSNASALFKYYGTCIYIALHNKYMKRVNDPFPNLHLCVHTCINTCIQFKPWCWEVTRRETLRVFRW